MKTPLLVIFLFIHGIPIILSAQEEVVLKKMSGNVQTLFSGKKQTDSIDLIVSYRKLEFLLAFKQARVINLYNHFSNAWLKIKSSDLNALLNDNNILFADTYRVAKEELTTGANDLTLNKVNWVHHQFPATNGNGIVLSIKEHMLDTSDIDFKGRFMNTGGGGTIQNSHASIIATIAAGAGNTSPFAKGVAPGATLTSASFTSLFPEAAAIYKANNIRVQNHSYGTGIENYYGAEAVAYDLHVYNNPAMIHVFSAGNTGTSTSASGPYTGVASFANLTGTFKMAKNVITVGHVDSFNTIVSLSSKGPAFDGRIKPELVAYGEGGSSGAAAMVSGTAVLLQHAYQSIHQHLPPAFLVKGILINAADDVGAPHPDFSSGYGSLNAWQALKTVTDQQFFIDSLAKSEIKSFPIFIPANASKLKVTLVWTDLPATINTSKALVNDLDLVIRKESATWLPWVLNHYGHEDSLRKEAIRKKDTLNTVEQVTIDRPEKGIYTIEITAPHMHDGRQTFALVYQVDTLQSFDWTFPTPSHPLTAGKRQVIRWQTSISGSGSLEYALDGQDWQTIDSAVDINKQYYHWSVPDAESIAQIRLSISGSTERFTSDTFVVAGTLQMNVGFNCTDSLLLYWNNVASDAYQLYYLGDKYMQPLLTINDTIAVLSKTGLSSSFFAVAPKFRNGKEGLRSYTLNYNNQGADCYFRGFYAVLDNDKAILAGLMGTLYNITEISYQELRSGEYQTIHTINNPTSLNLNYTDLTLVPGVNHYRVQVKLHDGRMIYSNSTQVFYFTIKPVMVYPNPARQGEAVQVIVNDTETYRMEVYNIKGQKVHVQRLNDLAQPFQSLHLTRGMYILKILDKDGNSSSQKLVIY